MSTNNIAITPNTYVVQIATGSPTIISTGMQGPEGPPGAPGATLLGGATISFPVSANISQYQVVAVISGVAEIADSSNMTFCNTVAGVCIAGSVAGAVCQIQYTGQLENTSWTWVPNQPIFLGTLGVLTQTPPSVGFSQQIAIPLSATTILISIANPIVIN